MKFIIRYRWLFTTVVFTVGVILSVILYSSVIVHTILEEYTESLSSGQYTLKYRDAIINPFKSKIEITEATIEPVDSIKDAQIVKNKYHITFDNLFISIEDLLSIYTKNELHVDGIEIENPFLTLYRAERKVEKRKISVDIGNLYLLISDFVEVLRIDFLTVKKGKFIDGNTLSTVEDISFSLNNILIDSLSSTSKEFYSNDLNLEVGKQTLTLPDSLHKFSFDLLKLSTRDSILEFTNAHMQPLFQQNNDTLTLFDIYLEKFNLKGLDYLTAYRDNRIEIDSIQLLNPSVKVDIPENESRRKIGGDSFERILFRLFSVHSAHILNMKNGSVELNFPSSTLTIDSLYARLSGIEIDSGKFNDYKWLKDASFRTGILNFEEINQTGSISMSGAYASTQNRSFQVRDIEMNNIGDNLDKLYIKEVRLGENDPLTVLNTREIHAGSLTIDRLELSGGISKNNYKNDSSEISVKIPYLRQVKSDTLVVRNSRIQNADLILSEINLNASDFYIGDEIEDIDSIFQSEKISMVVIYKNEDLTLNGLVSYDEKEKLTTIRDVEYRDEKNEKRNLSAGIIEIFGPPSSAILKSKSIVADSVLVQDPIVNWEIDSLGQDKIVFSPGVLKVRNGNFMISESENTFQLDSIDFKIYLKQDSLHIADLFSSRINMQIEGSFSSLENLRYHYPTANIKMDSVSFTDSTNVLNASGINLINWDQALFLSTQQLSFDTVRLYQPNARVDFSSSVKTDTDNTDMNLRVGTLEIIDGSVEGIGSTNRKLNLTNLSGFIESVNSNNVLLSNDNLLYGEKANLKFSLNMETDSILASSDSIIFSSAEDTWEFYKFKYIQRYGNIEFKTPFIKTAGLDLVGVRELNQLRVSSIKSSGGILSLTTDQRDSTTQLYDVQIDSFNLEDYKIVFKSEDKDDLEYKNIGVFARGINLSSNNILLDITRSEEVIINVSDFSYPLEDYVVEVEDVEYSMTKNKVLFKKVKLVPEYKRLEFSNTVEVQTDWFEGNADTIQFAGFDEEILFRGDSLFVENINIKNLDLTVFRDKHLLVDSLRKVGLPQTIFKNLKKKIKVDAVNITGTIHYSERPKQTDTFATIGFTQLDGRIKHLASDVNYFNKPMIINAYGKILDNSHFSAEAKLFWEDRDPFVFQGGIEGMDITILNQLLNPIGGLLIKSGQAYYANLRFDGNDDIASGKMELRYKNLKVNITNTPTDVRSSFAQGIRTFFANSFIIHKSNPRFFKMKKGVIFYERDKSRSIFNLWAKAILSGAVSSVGINRSKRNFIRYRKRQKKLN